MQPSLLQSIVPITVHEETCAMTATSKRRTTKSPAAAKLQHPAKEFSDPAEVLADGSLSTPQKQAALHSLEQDARQLAVASSEGMSGGEETQLRNVLETERSLERTSSEGAFTAVLHNLEEHRRRTHGTDTEVLIERAIESMQTARDAIARDKGAHHVPPGAAEPGSQQELQEELNKEKLDPGG
jgi:hypothetical protein